MSTEDFLLSIQPGLTILAALFATLWVSIRLFWFFFNYEKTLQEENLIKVKELNLNFRKKHIERRIENLFIELKTSGYSWGVSSITEQIYPSEYDPAAGIPTRKLKANTEIIDIVSEDNLSSVKQAVEKEAAAFAFSDEGQTFFSVLDRLYSKKHRINGVYKRSKFFCRGVYGCCLLIVALSIFGIGIQSFKANDTLIHLWLFLTVATIVLGLTLFFILLYYKYSLNRDWENQQLYGEE